MKMVNIIVFSLIVSVNAIEARSSEKNENNPVVFLSNNSVWIADHARQLTEKGREIFAALLSSDKTKVLVVYAKWTSPHQPSFLATMISTAGNEIWTREVRASRGTAISLSSVRWLDEHRIEIVANINPSTEELFILDAATGNIYASYFTSQYAWDPNKEMLAHVQYKPHFRGNIKLPSRVFVNQILVYESDTPNVQNGPVDVDANVVSNLAWCREDGVSRLAFIIRRENSHPFLVEVTLSLEGNRDISVGSTMSRQIDEHAVGFQIDYVSKNNPKSSVVKVRAR